MNPYYLFFIPFLLVACATTAPTPNVKQISQDTYEVNKVGGWGYDLHDLKKQVKDTAELFAKSAGKDMVIISEEVQPDNTVGTYPAYDDTYKLKFRLVEKAK
jgi:hypothetical protein